MKVQVVNERENPLLKRKELLLSIDYEGGATPSKADLQKFLSEQLNTSIENLEISKVLSEVGKPKGKAWIKIWQEKKVPIYSEIEKEKKAPKKEEKPKEKPEKQKEKVEEKMEAKLEE